MADLPRRRGIGPDLSPLRDNPDYRRLFIGQSVSRFGDMITVVAFPYQVWQLTRSSLAVGLVGLFEVVPLVVLALVGGAYADAHDRKKILVWSELGLMACAGTLAALALMDRPPLWTLYLLAAVTSGLSGFHRPALDALVPRLTRPDQQPAVAALRSAVGTFAQITGPALGGVLIATIGLAGTYLVDAATFAVSLGLIVALPAVPPENAEPPSLARIREGLAYAFGRRDLLGTYFVDMVAMFFGMPNALFPAFAERLGGSSALGLLYSAPAAGAFVVSVTSGWSHRVVRQGRAITIAAMAWGLAIVGFGLAGSLPVALLCLALAGAADMVSAIFRMTIWNQTIPDQVRGRLAGIEQISYLSGPYLGNVEAGAAAALFGLGPSVVLGGVLCVVGCGAVAWALPAFWRYVPPAAVQADGREGGRAD
ncbi:MAG: MFS transporter [Gemmatimonadales bacterium]|nr:MFS transporter [Gemmatimonadales bacterium]